MKRTYRSEKAALIDEKKTVEVKGPGQLVTAWTVVGDVKRSEVPEPTEFHDTRGICGFDFNNKTVVSGGNNKRINLHELFMHMWGDDDNDVEILTNMNQHLSDKDPDELRRRNLPTTVKPFSRKEFWIGWGLVLSARVLEFKTGMSMWKKNNGKNDEKTLTNMVDSFDPRPYMSEKRFKEWKAAVSWIYANDSIKDEDPW
jgi:hypothetical protein